MNKFEALYLASKDAIMTLEPPDWKFTAGNPSTISMFGAKDEDDFTSRAPWNYSPEFQSNGESSNDAAKEVVMKAMKEGTAFFEWTHKRLNGEEFPATVLLTKTTVDGKDFLQATVRDISKLKKAEQNLTDKIVELEKFQQLTTERELKMIELKNELHQLREDAGIPAPTTTEPR